MAYVNLSGRVHYLGEYGTPESRELYARLKSEWLATRHAPKFAPAKSVTTMANVCLAFLDHAESYYGKGKELSNLEMAIRPVSELYATLRADEFGPVEYRAVRQWWLDRECKTARGRCTRSTINGQMNRLRRVLKWAVGQSLIPPSVHQAISCVDPLKSGRTDAPEGSKVKPVEMATVEATLSHLPEIVADMVRVQLLTGARPGEICALKPSMIDRSAEVWTITLVDHKTAHHGRERFLYAGAQAQAILCRYLLRGAEDHLFRPCDTLAKRLAERASNRRTPAGYGNRAGTNRVSKPKRKPGERYTTHSYARAIERACDKAFPAPEGLAGEPLKDWVKGHRWSPNQLRHSRATEIRKLFGLESASSVLGHSNLQTTQIYAEADRERAVAVARAIG
jgi:integrase